MEITLKLSGGKQLPLYFGTWSLSRFCELNGNLSFTQFQILFAQEFSFSHIIQLILCGAEHYCRKNKLPFEYTDIDASDWIDEIGGIESQQAIDVIKTIAQTINPSYQGIEVVKTTGEEKKSETTPGLSSGQIASEPA